MRILRSRQFAFYVMSIDDCERYRVQGDSMLPSLKDGDEVLVQPTESYQIGDIVVAKHPFKQSVVLIKRVSEIDKTSVFLTGDNPRESTDSRTLGKILIKDILGKVEAKVIKITLLN